MHGLHHSLGFCKFKHILGQEEKRKKERLKSILQPACSAAPAVTRQIMPLKLVHGMLLTSRITETNSHFFHMLFVTHTNTNAQNSPSDAKARWKSSKCAKNHRKPMSAVKSMTALCTATSCLPEQRKDEQGGVEFQVLFSNNACPNLLRHHNKRLRHLLIF